MKAFVSSYLLGVKEAVFVPQGVMSQKKKDMTEHILKRTLETIRCNRLYGNIKNYKSVS